MDNKYNVGDFVQVEDCDDIWYEVVDVHVYIGISKGEGRNVDITYGVIDPADGEYLDVDEEEITNVKGVFTMTGEIKLKAMFKRGKVNELLDMLNSVNALIKVVGETDEIMAEKQAIVSALQGLTAKG